MRNDPRNPESWFEPAADVLTTEYIMDRYPGFLDQPPEASQLKQFITDTTRLFQCLSGRSFSASKISEDKLS